MTGLTSAILKPAAKARAVKLFVIYGEVPKMLLDSPLGTSDS